ncbi:MAG TPA: glycosyltransferase family 9 protein [Rhodanobacteraceae bacterium]|jgi:heptosyltransferase-2/heptosyltransferase-3|nr:glycosyltransferase family 9 protein [Rhodanobacteraceae bacterium]
MFSYAPLVVRFGGLEDMVLLTPLLRLLHRRYGQSCGVVGSGSWLEPLLDGHPDVQGVLTVSNPERPYWLDATQREAARSLRMQSPGAVYVCDDTTTGARRLLRHAGVLEDQCRFANPDCPRRDGEHWIDRWRRFAEMTPPAFAPSGFRAGTRGRSDPCLVVNANDREDLAEWLARRGLAQAKIIVLQPESECVRGGGRDRSSGDSGGWPRANWLALIRALLADPADLTVVTCDADADLESLAVSPRIQAVGDDLPLRRFMALCEHAAAMISVDSGRAQVAAALGCPLIALYGARPPSLWCPRSASGSPVVDLGGPPARSRTDEIALDEVLAAWRGLRMRDGASALPNCAGSPRDALGRPITDVPQ